MIKYFIIKIFTILIFLHSHPAFACRYNVRETGFVDLCSEFYTIYLCIDQNTSPIIIKDFQQITSELLKDSNIHYKVVDLDVDKNNPTKQHLNELKNESIPAILLISPDGQSIVLPVNFEEDIFEHSLEKVVKDILYSPARKRILEKVIDNYGVVFLVEGKNKEKNKLAKNAIAIAINNIKQKMVLMPKPIKHPPALVTLSRELIKSEKILLWSLGIDPEQIDEPIVAVIYGRARWIGPLFIGNKITSNNLTAILITIGLDCECGLDKNWIQGTMLPLKWDQILQSRIAKNLGFDPENPMIKMEINRILRTGSSYPGVPMNILSEYLNSDSLKRNIKETPSKEEIEDSLFETKSTENEGTIIQVFSFYIIISLSILIVGAGLFILLRKSKDN